MASTNRSSVSKVRLPCPFYAGGRCDVTLDQPGQGGCTPYTRRTLVSTWQRRGSSPEKPAARSTSQSCVHDEKVGPAVSFSTAATFWAMAAIGPAIGILE